MINHSKYKEKRPLGRLRRRGEDNIKIDVEKIGYECMYWIHLAQDMGQWRAFVNMVLMNHGFHVGVRRNFLTSEQFLSLSRTLIHGAR
jgi:hypothetical protein